MNGITETTGRILVIEDDEDILSNITEVLQLEGWQVLQAENGKLGVEKATLEKPDLIICDIVMPYLNGYDVLGTLQKNPDTKIIPFIFLTSKSSMSDLRQGMNLGADDYLVKPFQEDEILTAVSTRLGKSLASKKLYNEQLKSIQNEMENVLHFDSLTGLPNRLTLQQKFIQILNESSSEEINNSLQHSSNIIAVLALAIDRVDVFIEMLGYEFTENIVKLISDQLSQTLGVFGGLAYLGNYEFAAILNPVQEQKSVTAILERLLDQLSKPLCIDGQEFFVSISIGAALHSRHSDNVKFSSLLKAARNGMNLVKQQGGDGYQYVQPTQVKPDQGKSNATQIALETELRYAIEREEFELYYQPVVDPETKLVSGAEALLRWQSPKYGFVSPGKFIPLAEEIGLISRIDDWVLLKACQQLQAWQLDESSSFQISINLSGASFHDPSLSERINQTIRKIGLEYHRVKIEVTEGVLVSDVEKATRQLNALRELGIQIAIDDFGTGYSSLGYLKNLPFDILKIDRCFVQDVHQHPQNGAITEALISLAHQLGLNVVAEGVETEAELNFLRQHSCDCIQGYFFSPPVKADALKQLLLTAPGCFS